MAEYDSDGMGEARWCVCGMVRLWDMPLFRFDKCTKARRKKERKKSVG